MCFAVYASADVVPVSVKVVHAFLFVEGCCDFLWFLFRWVVCCGVLDV